MSYTFPRQEIVSAADFDPLELACPTCGSGTLVLHGQMQIGTRLIQEDGVTTDQKTIEENGSFDLQVVDCLRCEKTLLIRDPEKFILESENLALKDENQDLREFITRLGGAPPTDPMNGVGYRN